MKANNIIASLNDNQIRIAAAKLLPAKFFDEFFTPESGNIALLRSILEDHVFEYDTTDAEILAAAEPSELSHAGQCLDIYLMNTADIYDLYTLPTIAAVAKSVGPRVNWNNVMNDLCALNPFAPSSTVDGMIYRAIDKARRLVNQFDGLKPTDTDLQQVTRNYAEYIADCAKSEILEAAAL